MLFRQWDVVMASRDVRAGLDESGPAVCGAGDKGYVISFNSREPDGVHVMLESGNEWWFKPSQLVILHDVYNLKIKGRNWIKPDPDFVNPYADEEVEPVKPRSK